MNKTQTLYEVLEVAPGAAFSEIRAAYRQLQAIYDRDSLSTYSLFSSSERQAILDQAEEAFATLTDPAKREAYDDQLVAQGRLTREMCLGSTPRKPAPVFQAVEAGEHSVASARMREKTDRLEVREMKAGLMADRKVTGARLKALRQAAGISLADIFESSRVSVATLEAIEAQDSKKLPAGIYLKGFLKSYAQCLGLDPATVVSGYIATLPRP